MDSEWPWYIWDIQCSWSCSSAEFWIGNNVTCILSPFPNATPWHDCISSHSPKEVAAGDTLFFWHASEELGEQEWTFLSSLWACVCEHADTVWASQQQAQLQSRLQIRPHATGRRKRRQGPLPLAISSHWSSPPSQTSVCSAGESSSPRAPGFLSDPTWIDCTAPLPCRHWWRDGDLPVRPRRRRDVVITLCLQFLFLAVLLLCPPLLTLSLNCLFLFQELHITCFFLVATGYLPPVCCTADIRQHLNHSNDSCLFLRLQLVAPWSTLAAPALVLSPKLRPLVSALWHPDSGLTCPCAISWFSKKRQSGYCSTPVHVYMARQEIKLVLRKARVQTWWLHRDRTCQDACRIRSLCRTYWTTLGSYHVLGNREEYPLPSLA